MSVDLFEVFDRTSPAPPPPRGRATGLKSALAIGFALALLAGLGLGGWAVVTRLSQGEPPICTAEANQQQLGYETWLVDLAADALDKRDADVQATGCTDASPAPSARLVIVDDGELEAVVGTLTGEGCRTMTVKLPANCSVTTDQGPLAIEVRPVSDKQADGDYELAVTEGHRATAG